MLISTVVFFDLETTGLPYQERNRTKIIEVSFVAISTKDIMRNIGTIVPPASKLTFMLNPQKPILSTEITGITNDMVKYSPTFKEKFNTIKTFLEDLNKPVCLVAHNGNAFDYKILIAECIDANVSLPTDLLCGDSMPFFKLFFKNRIQKILLKPPASPPVSPPHVPQSPEITDDEDDWPDLNVTPEEFQEIDDLCSSMSDGLNFETRNESKIHTDNGNSSGDILPKTYKLVDIFTKLLGENPQNAHRAEDDCIMLLQSILVCQNMSNADESINFLTWLDNNSKPLNQITPLKRK